MKYNIEKSFPIGEILEDYSYEALDENLPKIITNKDYKEIISNINKGIENHSLGYVIIPADDINFSDIHYLTNARTKVRHKIVGGGLVEYIDIPIRPYQSCLLVYLFNEINIFDEYYIENL